MGGEVVAVITDAGVEPFGQIEHPVGTAGPHGVLDGGVLGAVTLPCPEGEVLTHRRGEEVGARGGEHHRRTQCRAESVQVDPVEGDAPLLDGHNPGEDPVEGADDLGGRVEQPVVEQRGGGDRTDGRPRGVDEDEPDEDHGGDRELGEVVALEVAGEHPAHVVLDPPGLVGGRVQTGDLGVLPPLGDQGVAAGGGVEEAGRASREDLAFCPVERCGAGQVPAQGRRVHRHPDQTRQAECPVQAEQSGDRQHQQGEGGEDLRQHRGHGGGDEARIVTDPGHEFPRPRLLGDPGRQVESVGQDILTQRGDGRLRHPREQDPGPPGQHRADRQGREDQRQGCENVSERHAGRAEPVDDPPGGQWRNHHTTTGGEGDQAGGQGRATVRAQACPEEPSGLRAGRGGQGGQGGRGGCLHVL